MGSLLDESGNNVSTARLASDISIESQSLESDLESRDSTLQAAQIDLLYNAAVILEQTSILNLKLELDKWL